jgi:hypothetical protein
LRIKNQEPMFIKRLGIILIILIVKQMNTLLLFLKKQIQKLIIESAGRIGEENIAILLCTRKTRKHLIVFSKLHIGFEKITEILASAVLKISARLQPKELQVTE